ncbi:MAG: hypothetical protein HZC55_01895 [Verrucomicrobia bacterium]|nr:hypothetical protein [Verrucomicrobiota bacterium]
MKSFLHGKKSLPLTSLRVPGTPPAQSRLTGVARTAHASCGVGGGKEAGSEPHVEVVKEGDKVVRLVVVCSCGQRVEVECLYAAGT